MLVRQAKRRILYLGAALLLLAAPGLADVDLVLETYQPSCETTLGIDLFAKSDSPMNQPFNAMDVVLTWDPNVVTLLGHDALAYDYAWMESGFSFGDLNEDWSDGDAMYTAFARFDAPAYATPAGLLVTTFIFERVTGGAVDIAIAAEVELYETLVAGIAPGSIVTGQLDTEFVAPSLRGDVNCDGRVDYFDINPLLVALDGQSDFESSYPTCNWLNADCDCDQDVDYFDIGPFLDLLGTGS